MLGNNARRLARLLDRERALLARADIGGLTRLSAEKWRLAAALDQADVGIDALQALKISAARNDALYRAVLGGIADARSRIEQLRHGAPAGTYGARGQRADIGPVRSSLHRRA